MHGYVESRRPKTIAVSQDQAARLLQLRGNIARAVPPERVLDHHPVPLRTGVYLARLPEGYELRTHSPSGEEIAVFLLGAI